MAITTLSIEGTESFDAKTWNSLSNEKTNKTILVINNKVHMLEVPKKNSHISEQNSDILHKEDVNGDNSDLQKSELFYLMQKFVNNKCLICGFVSTSTNTSQAKRHMLVHATQRPFKCNQCDKAFLTKGRLLSHEIVHDDKLPYSCEKCNKRFRRIGCLRVHENRHAKKICHICVVCGKGFISRGDLAKHNLSHTGERPYSCSICGKTYSLRKSLKAHAILHTDERPFKCNVCGKYFSNRAYAKVHSSIHQGKNFECDICYLKFNFKSNLTQHKLTHSSERLHFCDLCGKQFKLPHHLRQHLQTHVNER